MSFGPFSRSFSQRQPLTNLSGGGGIQGLRLDSPLLHNPFSSGLAPSLAELLILPLSNKISKPLSYRKADSLSLPAPAGFSYPLVVRSTSSLLASMALLKSGPD